MKAKPKLVVDSNRDAVETQHFYKSGEWGLKPSRAQRKLDALWRMALGQREARRALALARRAAGV